MAQYSARDTRGNEAMKDFFIIIFYIILLFIYFICVIEKSDETPGNVVCRTRRKFIWIKYVFRSMRCIRIEAKYLSESNTNFFKLY